MTTHPDLIINSAGRIELKPTEEDIIFYVPFNNDLHAEVSEGDSLPLIGLGGRGEGAFSFSQDLGGSYEKRNLGFGDTRLVYKKENFESLTSKGSVVLCAAKYNNWFSSEERDFFEFTDTSTGDSDDSNDLSNNNGKIKVSYTGDSTTSNFYVKFYSDNGDSFQGDTFEVENSLIDGFAGPESTIKRCFDFRWDENIYQLYINNYLVGLKSLKNRRGVHGAFVYHFLENTFIGDLIIRKNERTREPMLHRTALQIYNYALATSALNRIPFVDIPFGNGFQKNKIRIEVEAHTNVRFLLKSGDTYFRVSNREWQDIDISDLALNTETNVAQEIRENVGSFPFEGTKQVFFRVYFPSNGREQTYLNKLKLIKLPTSRAIDYSEVYTYIRTKLGEPTIPVELTNQQLQSCIDDTIYYYNRYRNNKVEMEKYLLEGSFADGWNLPDEVKEEDILDVIIKPSIPFGFYRGRSGLLNNLYLQYIFSSGGGNLSSNIADYRITMSAIKDYAILLGSQPKWEIIGNKIKIWPDPPAGSELGIRYLSNVIPDDVVKDNFFRDLALAEAKILLGTIRSTFPGGVPGGFDNIQLNGESLLQEGKVEKERAIQRMIKAQEPLFLNFF